MSDIKRHRLFWKDQDGSPFGSPPRPTDFVLATDHEKVERELTQAKAELAALKAERDALMADVSEYRWRLDYIRENIGDNVAIRFALESPTIDK